MTGQTVADTLEREALAYLRFVDEAGHTPDAIAEHDERQLADTPEVVSLRTTGHKHVLWVPKGGLA